MNNQSNESSDLTSLMHNRRSVRAFLPTPVQRECIEQILDVARFSASGGNMQPWRVHVLFQNTIDKLYGAITRHVENHGFVRNGDYQYYPTTLEEPYKSRVHQSGEDLYASLNIGVRDISLKREQKLRNFEFYGAPVGLIVTMNKNLSQGSWIDMGLFLNALTLAIADRGLASCLQASFSSYGSTIRTVLDLNADNIVIGGVALGYEDKSNPINRLPVRRMPVEDFVTFYP